MVKPISKRVIAEIRQLHQTKNRTKLGLFVAEGEKMVQELLLSQLSVEMIACVDAFAEKHANQLANSNVYITDEKELSKISLLQSPNKVLAVVRKPSLSVPDFKTENGFFLMLDGIQDPGNMGTIIRTAEWFGVTSIICSEKSVDVWSPKVVQGSMGSIFRMPVYYGHLPELIKMGTKSGVKHIIGADVGGQPLSKLKSLSFPMILVLGSESFGISEEVTGLLTDAVRIENASGAATESLNVGIACGILLHDFLKA